MFFGNFYCPNDFFALDTHSIILGFFFLGFGPPSFDVGSITKVWTMGVGLEIMAFLPFKAYKILGDIDEDKNDE